MLAFINIQGGKVNLENVTFIGVQPSMSSSPSAVILQSVPCLEFCGALTYRGGSLRYLNNGFNYIDGLILNPFIYAHSLSSVEISDVTFQYNLVVNAYTSTTTSIQALIYLENFLSLSINNSQFLDNVLTGGVVFVESSVRVPKLVDSSNQMYLSTHLLFQDLTFSNNFGEKGIIQVEFSGDLLNVAMTNCKFSNNALVDQQLVSFSYSGTLITDLVTGAYETILTPGTNQSTSVWVPPRFLNITHVAFQEHSSFASLLSISNCANVHILDLNCSDNGEFDTFGREDLIIQFASHPFIYVSILPNFGPDANCTSLVSFTQTTNIAIESVQMTNNSCSSGGAGFSLSICPGTNTISAYTSSENQGSEILNFGLALQCGPNTEVSLQHLTMQYNTNSAGSLLEFGTNAVVSLSDSLFSDNVGDFGVCIYLENARAASIQRVTFINNNCTVDSGGVIVYSLIQHEISELEIIDCVFTLNQAPIAACLYIGANKAATLDLLLQRVDFTFNSATNEAAVLYIEPLASFTTNSSIDTCTFDYNGSPLGLISLQHKAGTLTISNSVFTHSHGGNTVSVIYLESEATTVIVSSTFSWNAPSPAIFKPNPQVSTLLVTIDCTFEHNSAVSMQAGLWTDTNSRFLNSQSSQVTLVSNVTAILSFSRFENNTGGSGGAVLLSESGFICSGCVFLNNRASYGGAICSGQFSTLIIRNSTFQGNAAGTYGSAILQLFSLSQDNSIANSTFYANEGNSVLYFVLVYFCGMDTVSIYGNIDTTFAGLYMLVTTNFYIVNSIFDGQSGSPVFFQLQTCVLTIVNSTFTNGSVLQLGGVSMVLTTLRVIDTTFQAVGGTEVGILSADSKSTVVFINVTINSPGTSSEGCLLSVAQSSLYIVNSTFMNYNGGVCGSNLMLQIIGSVFTNGTAAVACSQCSEVSVYNSMFALQTGVSGGVLSLITEEMKYWGQVTLENTTFISNTAATGGALYLKNMNLTITSCTFENNSASDITGVASGDQGGGIYLDCSITSMCMFNISNSTFINNTAVLSGGAISWNAVQPVLTNLTMANNTALYGSDIASFAIKLKFLSSTTYRVLIDAYSTNIPNIPPGQPAGVTLTAALVDHYDKIITIDNFTAAQLTPLDQTKSAVSGTSKVTATNGIFTFDNFTINADPESTAQIILASPSLSSYSNSSVTLNFEMRACKSGEHTLNTSCLICGLGTYSFYPINPCLPCPANAYCEGYNVVLPNAGYWRSGILSDSIIQCPYSGACLGGQPANQSQSLTGACATGYTSNLCQSCAVGFSRSSPNKCGQCLDETTNIVRLTFIVIAVVIVECILVLSALRSAAKPASVHSIYFKIFANYFQLVWLVTDFKLSWPDPVLQLFNVQEQTGGVSEQAYSFDCFIGNNKSAADTFYDKIIFIAVLPIGLTTAAVLFWVVVALWKHNKQLLKRELMATIVILYFLIQPNLVKLLFSIFSCTEIDSGEFWLTTDMAIKCWDSTHLFHIFAVGIPAITLWVFTVPLICLLVLIKHRRRQEELWLKMQFGFLLEGYKRRHFYWEFVILFRKLFVICCSVFMNNSIPVQALTVQVILVIAVVLQYAIKPFSLQQMNSMELLAIAVADITIYCGLYYLTDLTSGIAWLFFFLILGANLVFLVYWLKAILKYAFEVIAAKIPFFGHWIRPESFYRDAYIEQFLDSIRVKNTEKIAQFAQYDLRRIYIMMLQTNPMESGTIVPGIREKRLELSITSHHSKTIVPLIS